MSRKRKPQKNGRPSHPRVVRLEKHVEAYLVDVVEHQGGIAYKFTSPARKSVPDRLCFRPIPPEHREIVARYVKFVEAKKPGETATDSQQREHKRLTDLGLEVHTLDHPVAIDKVFYVEAFDIARDPNDITDLL